jgi:hypothetical protein
MIFVTVSLQGITKLRTMAEMIIRIIPTNRDIFPKIWSLWSPFLRRIQPETIKIIPRSGMLNRPKKTIIARIAIELNIIIHLLSFIKATI